MEIYKSQCPLCKKTSGEVLHQFAAPTEVSGDFAAVKCSVCGHCFTSPEPDDSLLEKLYCSGAFLENLASVIVENMEQVAQNQQWNIVQEFTKPGKILDIGCGAGTFLAGADKRGYEGFGLEKYRELAEFARERLNLDVRQGELGDDVFPAEFADAVTLWDVLEHLRDPAESLQQVQDLLKPEGTVFIALPNYASVEAERFGAHWAGWWVPLHLHHFSPKIITQLLERSGFEVVEAIYRQEYYVTALSVKRLLGQDTSDMGALVAKEKNFGYLARVLTRILPFMANVIERRALKWSLRVNDLWPEPEQLSYMTLIARKSIS